MTGSVPYPERGITGKKKEEDDDDGDDDYDELRTRA